jgi:DNA-binding transcriptional LysR family regulator
MDRDNLGTLSAFAVVAQERSFTRAAARLGVSPSALSHAIRRLEEKLGTQLLARSTRSVSMTQAGERLLARVGPAMEELSSAVQELGAQAGRPAGHVRISAPAEAAHRIILPMLPRFVEAYPDIVVEVLVEAAFTDIVARRLDAGVRLGESLAKDVVAVPISGPQRLVVIASPVYAKAHGTPKSPRDLRDHRCINQRLLAAGSLYKWEFARGREKMEVAVEGPLIFDDGGMVLEAVLAGIGLGYVMEERARPYLESGRLARVLDEWTPPFPGFYLYYPGRKQASAALAAFIDAIRWRSGKRR